MADIIPLNKPELDALLASVPTATPPDLSGVASKADTKALADAFAALMATLPDWTKFALASSLVGLAKMTDIPNLSGYAKLTDILSLSGYAKLVDIPAAPDLSGYALKNILDGQFTIAQLMALPPGNNTRKYAWCTDLYGTGDMMLSDGTNWKPVRPFGVQSQNADVPMTLTTLVHAPTQLFSGTMTAGRTMTISTANAYKGARFRITRTAGGTLFNLLVNGLNLALNQWADFEYDGTAFVKTASGGLL